MSQFMSVREVTQLIGVHPTTLWRWQRQGRFPSRRRIGPNKVGFVRDEIEAWLDKRPEIGRAAEPLGLSTRR